MIGSSRQRHARRSTLPIASTLVVTILSGGSLGAIELGERVALTGVASLGGQCQRTRDPGNDRCEAGLTLQPEVSVRPAVEHEIFVKLGLGWGDALNGVEPFLNPPWAADLEESLENINGRDRDHLLTAWYRFARDRGGDGDFDIVAGILDATDYLDTNLYSNDEFTQFMNSALVNGPNAFVPSYAPGLAGRWRFGPTSLTGVYMHVGRVADESFEFFGVEFGYRLETSRGVGNYRLLLDVTSEDFEDSSGVTGARRNALLLSCDQRLTAHLGTFLRVSLQDDDAAIDYRSLYSAGIDIGGSTWGRSQDNIGVGLAYLDGGNSGIVRSRVAEAYYRLTVIEMLEITVDLQYASDAVELEPGSSGWILGLRVTTHF